MRPRSQALLIGTSLFTYLGIAPRALADPLESHDFRIEVAPPAQGATAPTLVTPLCDGAGNGSTCATPARTDGADLNSIISQYGPRRLGATEMDFHRGIDIAHAAMRADNTQTSDPADKPGHTRPVYAVRAGTIASIVCAQDDSSNVYDGYRIVLEHRGVNADDHGRPFFTVYKHLWAVHAQTANGMSIENEANSNATVDDCDQGQPNVGLKVGDPVGIGQFLGCTGFTANGSHELHFEVRVAQRNADHTFSLRNYNRFAVNPLRLFNPPDPDEVDVTLTTTGGISVKDGVRICIVGGVAPLRIHHVRYDLGEGTPGVRTPLAQGAYVTANHYHVRSDYVDLEQLNYEFTHESLSEGVNCPVADAHGTPLTADVHFASGFLNGIYFDEPTVGNDADNSYERCFKIMNFPNLGDLGLTTVFWP